MARSGSQQCRPLDASEAETVSQPVEQVRQLFSFGGMVSPRGLARPVGLKFVQGLDHIGGQYDLVDSRAGFDLVQLLGEKPHERLLAT